MAAAQIGSNTISGHIYFRYCVGDNTVEPGNIENVDVGVGILFFAVLCLELSMEMEQLLHPFLYKKNIPILAYASVADIFSKAVK